MDCVVPATAFESERSTHSNENGWCLWCNYRPGPFRVKQTRRNYGLLGRLRGLVNYGLAGLVTARLPICEECATRLV